MIWLATLGCQLGLGFILSFVLLRSRFDLFTFGAISVPVGFAASSLIFYGCSVFIGFNAFHGFIHTGVLGFICFTATVTSKFRRPAMKLLKKPNLNTIVFAVVSLVLALFIVPRMYFPEPCHIHRAFQGDIGEELALMNSFYHGVNGGVVNPFKIRHPSCYKCHVRSRWLTAVHSAMLRLGGASLRMSWIVPSFLYFYSMCFMFLKLAFVYLRECPSSVGSLLIFLFGGGLGFFDFFETRNKNNKDLDYVFNRGTAQTEWSHPILHYMFALRPSQLSLCLSIAMLLVLTGETLSKQEYAFVGLLVGFLIPVQHQVFISAVIYLGVFFALDLLKNKKGIKDRIKEITSFGIFFAIAGGLPILHYLPRVNRTPMIALSSFWDPLISRGAFFPSLKVWWDALGPFAVVTLVIVWFFLDNKLATLYIPAIVVFITGNMIRFQGYSRQNIIFFYPLWMSIACIAFFNVFRVIVKKTRNEEMKGVINGVAIVLAVLSILSGGLGFLRLRKNKIEGWTPEMEAAAEWIAQNTHRKAVFISDSSDFDTVAQLSGKVSYLQNARNNWIYGYNVGPREQEIENFLERSDSLELAPKVTHVLNNALRNSKRHLRHWGRGNWSKVYSHGNITIYQRNKP